MDAAGPQDERVGGVPSAAEVAAFNHEMDGMFADLQKEFDYGQGLFDLQDRIKRMANLGRKLSIAEWKRMVKRTLGIDIMTDYYSGAQFKQLTERWVADNVGLIKTIPQETLGAMRDVVKTGFASGASGKTIAAQIQEAYDVSKYRAKFLARDQSAKLNAQITRQQQQDAGVTEYVWRTTGDSRVRESHRHLNGKRFKYSDPPIVDARTGRRENPGGDFQCRCVALPIFDIDGLVLPWGVSSSPLSTFVGALASTVLQASRPHDELTFKETGLTDNDESRIIESVELKKTLREVEDAKRGLQYEVGTLLSRDGAILKAYNGSAHAVSSPESDADMFMNGVFTHNHPGGRCFTLDDIKNFIELKLYEVRVSTPQGTYFSLRAGDGDLNRAIANVMEEEKVGAYSRAIQLIQQETIETGIELVGDDYQNHMYDLVSEDVDNWLTDNAAEFGYVYVKGRI